MAGFFSYKETIKDFHQGFGILHSWPNISKLVKSVCLNSNIIDIFHVFMNFTILGLNPTHPIHAQSPNIVSAEVIVNGQCKWGKSHIYIWFFLQDWITRQLHFISLLFWLSFSLYLFAHVDLLLINYWNPKTRPEEELTSFKWQSSALKTPQTLSPFISNIRSFSQLYLPSVCMKRNSPSFKPVSGPTRFFG